MDSRSSTAIGILAAAILFGAAGLAAAAPAKKYKAVEVKDGGKIVGVVSLSGTPPAKEPATVGSEQTAEKAHCGADIEDERYVVEDGKLANVVVQILEIEEGKAWEEEEYWLSNDKCRFDPRVQVMPLQGTLFVKNADPFAHNTHAISMTMKQTLFNLAVAPNSDGTKRKIRTPGVVQFKCDIHPWMKGFLHVLEHPYAVVTAKDGSFELADVPPGKYKLQAWHEKAGTLEKEIEVKAGEEAKADFEFSVKE